MKLKLYNSLSRKREIFTPIDDKLVKMYVCGPTVYDHPHIGNARSVVVYDVLYRILAQKYGKNHVSYVRNITDIDDKIMNRAAEEKISIADLTKKTTEYFHSDMDYLGCLRPNIEPKATDHVQEMIDIISKLIANNIAYESHNHVYFDVKKYDDYTKLSGRSFEDMFQGVRFDSSEGKRNPEDFVLWKPSLEGDDESAKFDSPFGVGRPGWHIECSAMSHKYLGEDFDIHGGGADLIFPHHTNEIAQSCAAFPGSSFAQFWVHNGFLTVNHDKMSKSLKNFITVHDLRQQGLKGEVVRLFLLSNHYRKPIDYNDKAISDANTMLSYWYRAIENIDVNNNIDLPDAFLEALYEDINTNNAIKIINDFAKEAHAAKDESQKIKAASNMLVCAQFLGLMSSSVADWFQNVDDSDQIEKLIEKRLEAKSTKDWKLADQIREELSSMGISIEDKPDGTTKWKKL